ncbi:MAG: hypothetical protein MSH66_06600 [Bacteroidales bacterium]|nr:hypothetical protein [Bacteroidales bacterium]
MANPVEYYVCCVGNSATKNYYVVWDTSASKFSRTNAALTTNFTDASTDASYPYDGAAKFIIIATETQGLYKIYCTTSGTYATYSSASNGASAVTSTATESEAKTWKIITNRGNKAATPYAFDIVPGEIATPANTSPSWNFHGGVGQESSGRNVGFWDANDDSSVWSFVPVAGYSNFVPAADKAYYIDPVQSDVHLAFYMPGISNAVMGVHGLVGNGNTPPSLGNLFTITATNEYVAGEQWFTISPYALDVAHQDPAPSYVRWLNTNDANANVAVATTNSNNKWRILQSSTTGQYTIRPNSADLSWNCRGNSNWDSAIGLWTGGNNVEATNNRWEFTEINASDAAVLDPLVGAYRTLATQRVQSKVSYPEPADQDCPGLPTHEAFNDLLNTISTTSDLGTLQKAVGNLATLPVKTFTSADNGVYTIKNVSLNKYLYITDTDNAKHATLLNDETEMKQKHYFYVKFNDNGGIISIKNSTGFEATRGPQGKAYTENDFSAVQLASESSPLAMQIAWNGANLTGANTFLLPTVHSTAQEVFTIKYTAYNSDTNPYFLTTWTTTGTADQYVFTKVDITDAARRDVVILSNSTPSYVTYDSNNVYNGGFVYSVAPDQSEFTAMTDQAIWGYECGDDFVRVLYDAATPNAIDKTAAQTLLAKTGVGYPKADAEVRANLTKLLGYSFMSSDELTAAIANYKGAPSQIQLPESGKAYTITFRPRDTSTGTYRYIYRDGQTTNLKTAVRNMSTPASDLPESAVFVCNEFEAGKYILTPVMGGGFVKVNTRNSESKLQVGATYAANINDIVFQPLTDTSLNRGKIDDTSDENLFGYMTATIQERENERKKNSFIIYESNGTFDSSDAPFLDGSHTSALIIEEVDYANHPTLLEIKGDKMSGVEGETHIGTFSAPFETVIPTGVRAYYAQTAEASTGISLAEISSGTIPANEGVIITATTATPGYFAPATASTSITGNKLSNSAGAAHTIVDYDYILATANEVTALYKAKVGGSALKMNKAYLNLGIVLSPSFKLSFDGELTGIASTLLNADESDSLGSKTPVYDLSGRRVAQPMRGGIYIRDGKKFIVK